MNEKGKKKLSTKSSSEKIDKKIKAVDANQNDETTQMNDQRHKQPWRKPNWWTVEGKDGVLALSVDKKAVKFINNFDDGESLRNANPGTLRDRERNLIHRKASQGNEFISENEDDELIQTRTKRADEFVSKCSRRPQPQLPEEDRKKDGSRAGWIDQPTFIKRIITSLKEKWIHGYQNRTVMSNKIKIV